MSIRMSSYEALYGKKYEAPLCWIEVGERKLIGPEIIQQIEDNIKMIKVSLKVTLDSKIHMLP